MFLQVMCVWSRKDDAECVSKVRPAVWKGFSALFLSTPLWLSALITFDKRGLLNPNYPKPCLSRSPSPFIPSAWRSRSFQSSSPKINWPRSRSPPPSRLLTSFGNQRSSLVRVRMSGGRRRDSCASGCHVAVAGSDNDQSSSAGLGLVWMWRFHIVLYGERDDHLTNFGKSFKGGGGNQFLAELTELCELDISVKVYEKAFMWKAALHFAQTSH